MIILFDDGCCRGVEAFTLIRYAFLGLVDDRLLMCIVVRDTKVKIGITQSMLGI